MNNETQQSNETNETSAVTKTYYVAERDGSFATYSPSGIHRVMPDGTEHAITLPTKNGRILVDSDLTEEIDQHFEEYLKNYAKKEDLKDLVSKDDLKGALNGLAPVDPNNELIETFAQKYNNLLLALKSLFAENEENSES